MLTGVPIEAKSSIAELLGPQVTSRLCITTKQLRLHYLSHTDKFFKQQLTKPSANPIFDFLAYPKLRKRGILYSDIPWVMVAISGSLPVIMGVLADSPEMLRMVEKRWSKRWVQSAACVSLFTITYVMDLSAKHLQFLLDPDRRKHNNILKFIYGTRRSREVVEFYLENIEFMKELFFGSTNDRVDVKWLDNIGILSGLKSGLLTRTQYLNSHRCKWTNMLAFVSCERRIMRESTTSIEIIKKTITDEKPMNFRRAQKFYPKDWADGKEVDIYIRSAQNQEQQYELLKLGYGKRLNIIGPGAFFCLQVTERSTNLKRMVYLFGEKHDMGRSLLDGKPDYIHLGEFMRNIVVGNPSVTFDNFMEIGFGTTRIDVGNQAFAQDPSHIDRAADELGDTVKRGNKSIHANLRNHAVDVRIRIKNAHAVGNFVSHVLNNDDSGGIESGETVPMFNRIRRSLRINRQMRWMDPKTRMGLERFLVRKLKELDDLTLNSKSRASDVWIIVMDAYFLARALRKFRDGSFCGNIFGSFGFHHTSNDLEFFLQRDIFETRTIVSVPEHPLTSFSAGYRRDAVFYEKAQKTLKDHFVDISKYVDKLQIVV